jgi:hypothetical protein
MKIEEILINGMLRDFYDSYNEHKKGYLTNHIAGEKLFNLMSKNNVDIVIDGEVKKELWLNCKKNYAFHYGIFKDYPVEAKKKLLERYYKSAWMEYWLNLKADEGQVVELGTTTNIFLKYKRDEDTTNQLRRYNNDLGMAIFDLQNPD